MLGWNLASKTKSMLTNQATRKKQKHPSHNGAKSVSVSHGTASASGTNKNALTNMGEAHFKALDSSFWNIARASLKSSTFFLVFWRRFFSPEYCLADHSSSSSRKESISFLLSKMKRKLRNSRKLWSLFIATELIHVALQF